jgi:monothiol glutaredoxin
MPLDDQTRQAIDALLTDNPVVLFMKGTPQQPQCGFSAKTTAALDQLLPYYVTIDVLEYPEVRDGIKEYGNWPTIPQLYVNKELIGGSDIVLEMLDSGELAEVLGVDQPDVEAPSIEISDEALDAIKNALAGQPNAGLRLQIDAGFTHSLALEPPKPGLAETTVGELTILMDKFTASRANGLKISLAKELAGTRFVFDNPNAPPPVNQIDVHTLKEKLESGEKVLLFDVRNDEERARAVIQGARPWDQEAMQLIDSLPKDTELVFHCHLGGRSQQAADHYRRQGYQNLHNVSGGIKAWAEHIEPDLPID